MFCARAFCGEGQSNFKNDEYEYSLFRVSNAFCEESVRKRLIVQRRRYVFFSLRANVYTGIRGVVLVVVVACAIFYLSKKSFCARVEIFIVVVVVVVVVSWYYYSKRRWRLVFAAALRRCPF